MTTRLSTSAVRVISPSWSIRPAPMGLCAKDRGHNADRHGRELPIAHHLAQGTIGSGRVRSEAVDQPDDADAGKRGRRTITPCHHATAEYPSASGRPRYNTSMSRISSTHRLSDQFCAGVHACIPVVISGAAYGVVWGEALA